MATATAVEAPFKLYLVDQLDWIICKAGECPYTEFKAFHHRSPSAKSVLQVVPLSFQPSDDYGFYTAAQDAFRPITVARGVKAIKEVK